jgi:hypothetical protein
MTYLFESEILRQFDHPHITKLIELFETPEEMHIVLEDYTLQDIFSRT